MKTCDIYFLRISAALREAEQANTVDETMVATSAIAVHSEPDDSQADEGFSEPKRGLFKRKVTYEVSRLQLIDPYGAYYYKPLIT